MNRFIIALLAIGLTLNPREVPSPLVGKAAPAFELPRLHEQGGTGRNRFARHMLGWPSLEAANPSHEDAQRNGADSS